MPKTSSVIMSRLVLLAGLLSASGAVYWFLSTTFAPIAVEPGPPVRSTSNLRFDPKADVSKNPAWTNLRPLTGLSLEPEKIIGRDNPFAPVATDTVP